MNHFIQKLFKPNLTIVRYLAAAKPGQLGAAKLGGGVSSRCFI